MDEDVQHTTKKVTRPETNDQRSPNLSNKAQDRSLPPETVSPLDSRQARLISQLPGLRSQIKEVETKLDEVLQQLAATNDLPASYASCGSSEERKANLLKEAQARVDKHVALLTRYSQLKEISMQLLTIIADSEGKRLRNVMDERAIDDD